MAEYLWMEGSRNMEINQKKQIKEILTPFKGRDLVVIPALQAVQAKFGYLPQEALEEIGNVAEVSANSVYGVASFYAQFRFTKPGKHKIAVCRGTACHVRGAPRIIEAIERALGIKEEETTADFEYSLETVACIGACALAPTIRIDEDTHGQLNTKKIEELFSKKTQQVEKPRE